MLHDRKQQSHRGWRRSRHKLHMTDRLHRSSPAYCPPYGAIGVGWVGGGAWTAAKYTQSTEENLVDMKTRYKQKETTTIKQRGRVRVNFVVLQRDICPAYEQWITMVCSDKAGWVNKRLFVMSTLKVVVKWESSSSSSSSSVAAGLKATPCLAGCNRRCWKWKRNQHSGVKEKRTGPHFIIVLRCCDAFGIIKVMFY